MRFFNKISLSSAPFYASLVVITSLAFFIGIFWAINEYQAYKESIENIRHTYKNQYEVRVKEELDKVVELIDYRRHQDDLRVELEIRERVQAAYTIASHNYRLYKDDRSVEEIRSMVIELLRPMRWNNGRGYYFIGRVKEAKIELFADEPFFEGKTGWEFEKIVGQDVVGEITKMISEKEAGLYRYVLKKPAYPGKLFSKIAFVKYFPPLDWFMGAGIYSDDLEETLQQEVLARIQDIQFGKDGEVFCFRLDGTILTNQNERLVGRSIFGLVDAEGEKYGDDLFRASTAGPQGGYVHYTAQRKGRDGIRQKLGYVQVYEDWGWGLGAAMFMDAMEQSIANETETYRRISFKNVFTFMVLFAVAVIFLLLSTFFYSLKIKQGISLFTNFLRAATDSKEKIPAGDMVFREFEDLSHLANRMVEDRIKNELLLHRDELRLDTLLRLGMMEKYSLQEKYDFILRRIVQITRSEEGYLALVNTTQSHITICSFFVSSEADLMAREGELTLPRTAENGGLPGKAVLRKTAVIANTPRVDVNDCYPYNQTIVRHLDVPIYNDGKIVVVAGVCNNGENYDNSDIRQMTMLLEGMWLHVLRQCSEEELARLERQIIAVSEEERSNIGRNLHDDLGSHLTGVELLSKALEQRLASEAPERAEQLGTIRGLIKDAIEKTRRLSHGLYPVHVIEYGLESAIEELVVEVENIFKVNFDLSWEGEGEKLGKNTATHLHYIIREAVFNAARHGKPNNIGVYVQVQDGSFAVKIVDDGKGFGKTPAATGLGFHTMKYRAKAIGAVLVISSDKKGGTLITVTGEGTE
ncbi:MAG: signal transduction histidine kinase [Desulforhopalus sp.]|jgi:signal transduction histidine kinase